MVESGAGQERPRALHHGRSTFDLRMLFANLRYPRRRPAIARMLRAETTERLSTKARKGDKQWATVTGKKRNRRSLSSRRSEEHTSELQSHSELVCRLLL